MAKTTKITYREASLLEINEKLVSAATGNPYDAHVFFAQFQHNEFLNNKEWLMAYDYLFNLLRNLKEIDKEAFNRIHKGVPYYFMGISAFYLHNYSIALFCFDAAVSEDLINDPGVKTPAIMFLWLEGDPDNQAAKFLTQLAETKLNKFLNIYNSLPGSNKITASEIRTKFLCRSTSDKQEWRTLATSFISFLLEMHFLIEMRNLRMSYGTSEPFFIHIFKGCVLFESLLKVNPNFITDEPTLGRILGNNIPLRKALGINGKFVTNNLSFDDVLLNLSLPVTNVERNLEISAQLRNTIGHNLSWSTQISFDNYVKSVTNVLVAILHTISSLY